MKKLLGSVISVLIAAFAVVHPVQAQKKVTASTVIWPELQVSYGVGEGGLFFLQNQYRINTDSRFNDFRESGLLSNFERIQFSVGYEQTFTDHWRAGAFWRHGVENKPATNLNFYSLFLRHNGDLKSLFFNKQLLVEYASMEGLDPAIRYSLMGELGKRFPVKQRHLTPSISYEASLYKEFEEESTYDEQFIERTRLRLNLTYELSSRFRFTPYFMRQTEYYYVVVPDVYDENDILITRGYRARRNRVTPVFGLELKYNLHKELSTASFAY